MIEVRLCLDDDDGDELGRRRGHGCGHKVMRPTTHRGRAEIAPKRRKIMQGQYTVCDDEAEHDTSEDDDSDDTVCDDEDRGRRQRR